MYIQFNFWLILHDLLKTNPLLPYCKEGWNHSYTVDTVSGHISSCHFVNNDKKKTSGCKVKRGDCLQIKENNFSHTSLTEPNQKHHLLSVAIHFI